MPLEPIVAGKPGRACCARCLRPQSTCICRWINRAAHEVEVAILQHPLEAKEAKNSARLLHLCLPRSRIYVGEVFGEQELENIIGQPWDAADGAPAASLLLYPGGAEMPAGQAPAGARLRLIVLDGTWRKSRKMLHLNPRLAQLPRLSLTDVPASRYRIRKAHAPMQLSTFEAVCHALGALEGAPQRFAPLLDAFDGFVAQQEAYRSRGPN